MSELNDEAKFACERLKDSVDDFVSLGRWSWGLLAAFLGQLILKSAEANGQLFPSLSQCKASGELARPFFSIIVILSFALWYFLWRAKLSVKRTRTYVVAVSERYPHPALTFALLTSPDERALRWMIWIRLAIIPILLLVWLEAFDVFDDLFGKAGVCPAKWEAAHAN